MADTSTDGRAPTRLRCEYQVNPIGLGERRPRLSWWVGGAGRRGARQSASRVAVASSAERLDAPDLWDSGRVESGQSIQVEYAGTALRSRARAAWRVTTWDEHDRPATSAPATFELGLLEQSDWSAQWIGGESVGTPDRGVAAPCLRKSFTLEKSAGSARAYVSALGIYALTINGRRVGEDVFAPGWTDYRHRVPYRTYDVGPLLREGENVVGAVLGDGWYCGHLGPKPRQQYGERPWLLLQLEVGSRRVVSDASWKVADGPVLENDLLMGEQYDAQRETPGWDSPGFDESAWKSVRLLETPQAALWAHPGPPVRATQELAAKSVTRSPGGGNRFIVDFGQNLVGRTRLTVRGEAGRTVRLRFAEVLSRDGAIYTDNLRGARQTDEYTLRGGGEIETYEPRFTFHGFRYAEVSDCPGGVAPDTLTAVVLGSDIEQTGTFRCSDPLVNRLQENIDWGQRGNFLEVPTDCPQRDERMGWTGDAQVFIATACLNRGVADFFTKWLTDLTDAQNADGSYPGIAPDTMAIGKDQWGNGGRDGGPAWADAGIICPWTLYRRYGDRRILERHYPSMRRYLEYLKAACPDGLSSDRGYGDWLSTDAATPKPLIGTAFYAHVADLMARVADVLGKPADAAAYREVRATAREAFVNHFLTSDGVVAGGTQTADLLALHFDLLPEARRRAVAEHLVADVRSRGTHLSTGFVGTPYMNPTLTATGHAGVAFDLLMQKTFPSWLYPVTQGATTVWERWDGYRDDVQKNGGFQDQGMNSFNHYAYGAIGQWLYADVAGLGLDDGPQSAGYKKLRIAPHVGGGLTSASATLDTPHGRAESAWTVGGGTLRLTVVVPPNTTATVRLPAKSADRVAEGGGPLAKAEGVSGVSAGDGTVSCEVAPGRYEFEVER